MNQFIRFTVFVFLLGTALFVWVAVAAAGLFLAFTNLAFMYVITPFIGLAAAICIIKCAMYVLLKSDPLAYLDEKVASLERFFGKKKV